MKRLLPALVIVALATPALAQKTPVPDLLKRAFTPPETTQLYAYDFESVATGGTAEKQAKSTIRGRIDPSRKKGDRVTITFLEDTSEKPQTMKQVDERFEKNSEGGIFCDVISRSDVTNVVDKGAAEGAHTFAFTPKAPATADGTIKDIMKKMTAVAVIDQATARVQSFDATLNKPHNVMLVAEIKTAGMRTVCDPAPNGRPYTARTEFDMAGSGLGNAFSSKSVQTITNLTPAGQ